MQDTTDGTATRKLQKVGGGTYTVSIPKEWATDQSLSAGDRVHLYPDGDGSLVVCRDDDGSAPASATVPVPTAAGQSTADADRTAADATDPFASVLAAAYAAGVERLTLTATDGFDEAHRRRVERLVRDRTGMRVTDATASAITVRTILDDDQVSVERTVVQLQFVALSLFRTAVDGVLTPSAIDGDRVADRREEATRLHSLVTRQFDRSLSRPSAAGNLAVDRSGAFDLYRTARALEGVARAAGAMAATVTDADGASLAPDGFRAAADATRLFVENATSAVVDDADVGTVQELYGEGDAVAETIDALDPATVDGDRRDVVTALVEAHRHGESIADVAHQATLRRGP